ncbi:hypothetical protein MFIFM68171_03198 [Madurella fahalii]|uniref:Uncharacterized protein n=1 Tax=Madurella fahalii TaxID=1157608 RepID=A0ABQ0G5G4_9PEZI
MTLPPLALRTTQIEDDGRYGEPLAGVVVSVILAMLSLATVSAFLTQRCLQVKAWKRLAFVQWLAFAIYIDSFLFVFAAATLQLGFGVDSSASACEAAILICLICYMTTKLIYLFLVERAYIIRSGNIIPRFSSKLYLLNSFGMLTVFIVVVVFNFIFRIVKVDTNQCIIGLRRGTVIPLIAFDLLVNIYLTVLFLKPLSRLYSYNNFQHTPRSRRLRTVALRTFVGCICTLSSSIVNLTVLMALGGEPGWICLMCCNSDILFSAIVIHWVTSRDNTSGQTAVSDESCPYALAGLEQGLGIANLGSTGPHIQPSNKPRDDAVATRTCILTSICSTETADAPTSPDAKSPPSNKPPAPAAGRGDVPPPSPPNQQQPLPQAPPPARNPDRPGEHVQAMSEVRVDIDYGTSISEEVGGAAPPLGNTVIIGAGGRR